ncbi:hypothetical protein RSAG8_08873, partial [Rhizoctonia solani AG-8 WAC10335]
MRFLLASVTALLASVCQAQHVGSVGPSVPATSKMYECNVLNYGAKADNATDIGPAIKSAFSNCIVNASSPDRHGGAPWPNLGVILTCRALNLGRSWWPIASQIAALANFYLTTWEEFHTGTLYLGYFSGPVEGIILIVILFILTGVFGTSTWDRPIADFFPAALGVRGLIGELPLNDAFMVFGGIGLIGNIVASYRNVLKSCRKKGESALTPLVRLIPFVVSTTLHTLWLAAPLTPSSHLTPNPITPSDSTVDPHKGFTTVQVAPGKDLLLHSPAFVPFLCMWGQQFAHQVGRMILAHVTHQPFPMFDAGWIWAAVSLVDAWSWKLFGRAPVLHSNPLLFILISLAASFLAYGRFCIAIINDITNYLGIACFTVRKKDENGEWKDVVQKEE